MVADWKRNSIKTRQQQQQQKQTVETGELRWLSRCSRGDKRSVDRLQPNREEDVCKEQTASLFIGCYGLSLLTLQSKSGSRLHQPCTLYEPTNLNLQHNSIYLERKCAQTHTCTNWIAALTNVRRSNISCHHLKLWTCLHQDTIFMKLPTYWTVFCK